MESVECGAAALAMVLNHYGRDVSLDELRDQVGVSRNGSRADLIIAAGLVNGLSGEGRAVNANQLKAMPGPVIAFWENNHYVVVEGFTNGMWHLNDPAIGRREVTDEEFSRSFSDVALTFTPNADFVPNHRSLRSYAQWMLLRLRGSRRAVVYAIIAGSLEVIPTLMIAFLAGVFVTQILAPQSSGGLVGLVTILVAMGLAGMVLAALKSLVIFRLHTKLVIRFGTDYLWQVLRLPTQFFGERSPGQLIAKMRLSGEVAELLSTQVATTVIAAINVVIYGAVLLWLQPFLTVVLIAIAALNIPVVRYSGRVRTGRATRLRQLQIALTGRSMYGLSTIESIKARGGENQFFASWSQAQTAAISSGQRFAVPDALLAATRSALTVLESIAVFALGGLLVLDGRMTVAELVTFTLLTRHFLAPIGKLSQTASRLQTTRSAIDQLEDVLGHPLDPSLGQDAVSGASSPDKLNGPLEFVNVTFGYSRAEPPLIENLNLVVPAGGRVALVGGSGSGRSTIGKLAVGLYKPWSGEIKIGGIAREDLPRDKVTSSVSFVDQGIVLFDGTVRDNIRLWNDEISDAAMTSAAQDACIHEDIVARRGGYDTPVAADGTNFSGGQAQRLEIARALAVDPAILVLDEATSDLDATTEAMIDGALRRRQLTCLIIAHRLSTVRDSDEILVLEHGKVVQRGTHDQLVAEDGPYRALVANT